jgi:hypothetical protein
VVDGPRHGAKSLVAREWRTLLDGGEEPEPEPEEEGIPPEDIAPTV